MQKGYRDIEMAFGYAPYATKDRRYLGNVLCFMERWIVVQSFRSLTRKTYRSVEIRGKRGVFIQVVNHPIDGVETALVIAGAINEEPYMVSSICRTYWSITSI